MVETQLDEISLLVQKELKFPVDFDHDLSRKFCQRPRMQGTAGCAAGCAAHVEVNGHGIRLEAAVPL